MGAVLERARLTMTPPCSPDSTSAAPPTWLARWRARTTTMTTATKPLLRSGRSSPPSAAVVTRPSASSPSGSTAATSPTPGCPPPTCRPRCTRSRATCGRRWRSPPTRIGEYHALQADVVEPVLDRDGVSLREVAVPVGRAGLYVPGGRAAYPSTVLMTAIPAQLAGVDELVLMRAAGGRRPGARRHAGRRRARSGSPRSYRIGGAQAIAALAYGTESIAAGRRDRRARATATSRWPSARSRAGSASSRSPVRPRWWSSPTGPFPPTFAAADLLAQAEHGPGGAAVLVAWDAAVIDATEDAIDRSPRRRAPARRDRVRRCAAGDGRSWSTTRSPRSTR